MKLRQTWWDFILQLSTSQKTFQNQHGYFSAVHLFLVWLCKMPSGWDGCWEHVFLFLLERAGVKLSPGLVYQGRCTARMPRMERPCCSFLLHQDEQQFFIIHLGKQERSWCGDSKYLPSIPCFHVCINKCSLRLYIPWRGRIFNFKNKFLQQPHTSNLTARLPGAKSWPKPPTPRRFDPKWSKPEEGIQSKFSQQHPSATEVPSGISPPSAAEIVPDVRRAGKGSGKKMPCHWEHLRIN